MDAWEAVGAGKGAGAGAAPFTEPVPDGFGAALPAAGALVKPGLGGKAEGRGGAFVRADAAPGAAEAPAGAERSAAPSPLPSLNTLTA